MDKLTDKELEQLLQQIEDGCLNIHSNLLDLHRIISHLSSVAGEQRNLPLIKANAVLAKIGEAIDQETRQMINRLAQAGIILDVSHIVEESKKWD